MIDDVVASAGIIRNDKIGSSQGKMPGKDRDAAQHHLLGLGEQVIAPIERGTHGLLSRQSRTSATGEHTQAIIETSREASNAKAIDASRCELDSEWNPIEPAANVGDDWGLLVGKHKLSKGRSRAFDEHLDRRKAKRFSCADGSRYWRVLQWREAMHALAVGA